MLRQAMPANWPHGGAVASDCFRLVHHEATGLHWEKLVVLVVELYSHGVETGRGLRVLEAEHVGVGVRRDHLLRPEEELPVDALAVVVNVELDVHALGARDPLSLTGHLVHDGRLASCKRRSTIPHPESNGLR